MEYCFIVSGFELRVSYEPEVANSELRTQRDLRELQAGDA